jgi:xylulokinase
MILQTYLGIDLGTSELKVLLLSEDGEVLGSAGAPLTVSQPHPSWSEQDPASWMDALHIACASLRNMHPEAYAAVRGIGLSGQMHGATLLNRLGEVLRPCILWNDTRSTQACIDLKLACPTLEKITGNLAMPGFTAPKLAWVRTHEPEIFAQTAKVLLPKDYIRLQLTNEYVSDMSDAAGTLWLDVAQRDWSDLMLTATGLTRHHMPRLVEGSEVSGHLSADAAKQLGLKAGTPVAGGAGDNAASAIGLGAVHSGDGFISLGTSGVIFLATEKFAPNPGNAVHAFCHALPGAWHQMAVMLSAASGLRWVSQLTGSADETALLNAVAQLSESERAQCPLFLPYLSGERTPHNNADASGVFIGLRPSHQAAHLGYAVIEGVSFGLLDGMNALRQAGGNAEQLQLVGGGARSALWAQLLADVLNIRIATYQVSSVGAALGAARLGQLAVEGTSAASIARVCSQHAVEHIYSPAKSAQASLGARYANFTAAYQALKPIFTAHAATASA